MEHALTAQPDVAAYLTPEAAITAVTDSPAAAPALRPMRQLGGQLALLRPRHWLKGTLVLAAPLLAPAAALTHAVPLVLTLLAFLTASSTIYVINDLQDREADRLHPVKRHRPLASGRVSTTGAVAVLAVLLPLTIGLLLALPLLVDLIIGIYLAMNIWYSLALKRQPLVDVSVVASGFVLRVLAGAIAVGLAVQPVLLISVYCACIALSLGKRRHELAGLPADGAARHRPALAAYTVPFLDHVIVVNLVAALVGYVVVAWQHIPPHGALAAVLTFPFAAYTVYRYLQLLMVERSGGDPVEDLARDRPMRINLGLWAAVLAPLVIIGAW